MQEDLAAAEAELAGWYETMQRETHALKRMYQHQPSRDLLEHGAKANSPAAEGPADADVPDWLKKVKSKRKMTAAEKGNRVAARQLPQVHRLVKSCDQQLLWHVHVCASLVCMKVCMSMCGSDMIKLVVQWLRMLPACLLLSMYLICSFRLCSLCVLDANCSTALQRLRL